MADFTINSLRAGMNDTDPPIALPDDQVVLAQNVEFNRSTLGERRRGAAEIDLAGTAIEVTDRVTFLHRHLPTDDESESELFALGSVDDPPGIAIYRKGDTWEAVPTGDGHGGFDAVADTYEINAQSLHGKLFLAFRNAKDRLLVFDGAVWRTTGLAEPAAPTAANSGSGSLSGTRYYRVRFTEHEGGLGGNRVLRRSEPSESLSFTPSGSGDSVVVTRPALLDEGETHWELEASPDDANFYKLVTAIPVATTAFPDVTDAATGYSDPALGFALSEQIGDYSLIWDPRYLAADQDRLLFAGSFSDPELASRIGWTPVYNDPGDGNDERIPVATDNYLDLNGFEGGPVTGLSSTINGYTYAFKFGHIYKMVRTGLRSRAYDAFALTKERGALPGSVVSAIDEGGRPAVFFLDPRVGPCILGPNGLYTCGADILETWKRINLNASTVLCRSLFYPASRQVHWWVAVDGSDTPNLRLVLQTNEMRLTNAGYRRGWSVWGGPSAEALAVCLYAENVDTGDPRSASLVPLIGREGDGLIWRTDTGDDDNGTDYAARIVTKPYTPVGILNQFGVMAGALVAKAAADATVEVTVTQDFGLAEKTVSVDLDPAGAESHVIKTLDDLSFSELRVAQFEFADPDTPGTRWELNQLALKSSGGQTA
jgi:hypothetical protein